jgi:SPP1 gp7 family putative phage head morphogenesis protein
MAANFFSVEEIEGLLTLVHEGKTTEQILRTDLGKTFTSKTIKELTNETDVLKDVRFTKNLTQFGTAKQITVIDELRTRVKKGESLDKFLDEHFEATNTMQNVWLQTEKDTTRAQTDGVQDLNRFEAEANDLPLLQFQTIEDGRVRPGHRALDGLIRPVGHPDTLRYATPLDYNCRCEWIQLTDETEAPNKIRRTFDKKVVEKDINPVIAGDPRKKGEIFSKAHPYFLAVSTEIIKRLVGS